MSVFATPFRVPAAVAGLLAVFLAAAPLSAAPRNAGEVASLAPEVGNVSRARGSLEAQRGKNVMALKAGGTVRFKDTLVTGANTRAEIRLVDDSQLFLGDDTRMTIDELVFAPNAPRSVVVNLSQGVFRMISGKFNKVPGGKLSVVTPVATIGVRGTDFWGHQEPGKLTMVLIDHGRLEITSDAGTVTLDQPLTGVVITAGVPEIQRITLTPEQLQEAAKTITY